MVKPIEIYADGADLKTMAALAEKVAGFTTNPSLMKKAGITDYRQFAREVLAIAGGKPVSFEVLADDLPTMLGQAREIASWGENVFVKIPVMNAGAETTGPVIAALNKNGVRVNVTAVMTTGQARAACTCLNWDPDKPTPGIISVFAGRIADAGHDPYAIVWDAVAAARASGGEIRILWASARQAYSVIEAQRAGAHIITLTPDLIAKLSMFGRDLNAYSLETVRQFLKDAEGITL